MIAYNLKQNKGGSKLSNVLKAKEDMQKSPEQLEQEKREIIASRLVSLDLNGKLKDDLISTVRIRTFEYLQSLTALRKTPKSKMFICIYFCCCCCKKAEHFYQVLIEIHSHIYDLNEKFDRQKYDVHHFFYSLISIYSQARL